MSGRISYGDLKSMNLIPTTWEEIQAKSIEEVYLQAHEDSPVYGPYLVKNARGRTVCKTDGSCPRLYNRDRGLLVKKVTPRVTRIKTNIPGVSDVSSNEMIDMLREALTQQIERKEAELEKLYSQLALLEEIDNEED